MLPVQILLERDDHGRRRSDEPNVRSPDVLVNSD